MKLGEDPFNISERRAYRSNNDFLIKINKEDIWLRNVELSVLGTPINRAYLEITKSLNGESFERAKELSDQITFHFETDSNTLSLNSFFSFPKNSLWRGQEVDLTLYIPEGTTIFLDKSTKWIMYNIPNVTNTYDPEMVGHYWQMNHEGLTCLDCDFDGDEQEEPESKDSTNRHEVDINISVN